MTAEQAETDIQPIPDKNDWPKTKDGTTDWEILFENKETGLILLADGAASARQLKQQTQTIIHGVFKRKRDQSIIHKVMAFLDNMIPADADPDPEQFKTMKASVRQLLRKVKNDRIKRAAVFIANKKKSRD